MPRDMGSHTSRLRGYERPPDDIEKTVGAFAITHMLSPLTPDGMVKIIEKGDKEQLGGWLTSW